MTEHTTHALALHHVNIPVASLTASSQWYCRVLGYTVEREFVEDGAVVGTASYPPENAVRIALRAVPGGVRVHSYPCLLAFAVPTESKLVALTAHLDRLGIDYTPLREATTGSLLEMVDPDGWVVRVYAVPEG